jgi:hypothetical protein
MLDDNDANEIGDDGTSDAEGDRCKYVISFKDGMKEAGSLSAYVIMQMKLRVG